MSEVKVYTLVMGEKEILNFKHGEEQRLGQFVKYKDYAELETKCAALAAENAGLKSKGREVLNEACKVYDKFNANVDSDCGDFMGGQTLHEFQFLLDVEAPATDAFLAEIHAQGVEMFADHLLCPDLDDTIRDFADQLRKGGNQ